MNIELVPGVLIDPGRSVTIVDEDGEVVVWTSDDARWSPTVFTSAVSGAILAAVKGPQACRQNIEDDGATLQALLDETAARDRG